MHHPIANGSVSGNAVVSIVSAAAQTADTALRRERLDVEGKTVEQVCSMLSSAVRDTELEPEWISPANTLDHADEATSGARLARMWPADSVWNRVAVSVDIGRSEGWIVHVDWIMRTEMTASIGRGYAVMPLLRAKLFNADRAWELARFIAYSIDLF